MVASTGASVNMREAGSTTAAHKGWEVNLLAAGDLRVRLFGEWVLASGGTRSSTELSRRLGEAPRPTKISFDAREVGAWDNVLIDFLANSRPSPPNEALRSTVQDCPAEPKGCWLSPVRCPNVQGRGAPSSAPTFSPESAETV